MNQRSAAGTGKMGKAPTIYDVSRIAGVSTTTISRVLNKPEMVNWQMELGGLDSPTTNQKFIDLRTGEVLNRLFIKDKLRDRKSVV